MHVCMCVRRYEEFEVEHISQSVVAIDGCRQLCMYVCMHVGIYVCVQVCKYVCIESVRGRERETDKVRLKKRN